MMFGSLQRISLNRIFSVIRKGSSPLLQMFLGAVVEPFATSLLLAVGACGKLNHLIYGTICCGSLFVLSWNANRAHPNQILNTHPNQILNSPSIRACTQYLPIQTNKPNSNYILTAPSIRAGAVADAPVPVALILTSPAIRARPGAPAGGSRGPTTYLPIHPRRRNSNCRPCPRRFLRLRNIAQHWLSSHCQYRSRCRHHPRHPRPVTNVWDFFFLILQGKRKT
jgi:hypothetical protein